MKLITFKYTKANGDVSNREVVQVHSPSKFYEGYDVSEMDSESFVEFSRAYNAMITKHSEEILELMTKFDLELSYKRFSESGVSDITTEHI